MREWNPRPVMQRSIRRTLRQQYLLNIHPIIIISHIIAYRTILLQKKTECKRITAITIKNKTPKINSVLSKRLQEHEYNYRIPWILH